VAIGWIGLGSGSGRSGKFDQKICQVTGRIRVNLIRVESGFGLNIIGFIFWVLVRSVRVSGS
jgi:hypothetical protein